MLIEDDGQHLIRCDRCGRADTVTGDIDRDRYEDAECWGWSAGHDGYADMCPMCIDEDIAARRAMQRQDLERKRQ